MDLRAEGPRAHLVGEPELRDDFDEPSVSSSFVVVTILYKANFALIRHMRLDHVSRHFRSIRAEGWDRTSDNTG